MMGALSVATAKGKGRRDFLHMHRHVHVHFDIGPHAVRMLCEKGEESGGWPSNAVDKPHTAPTKAFSLSLSRSLPLSVHISIYLSIYLFSLLCLTTPCRPLPLSPSGCSQTNPLLTPTSGGRHQCTIKCGAPGIPEDVGENIASPYRLDTGHECSAIMMDAMSVTTAKWKRRRDCRAYA